MSENLNDIKIKKFHLHWLIENFPEGFWSSSLCQMVCQIGAFVEKILSRGFF